MNGKKPLVIPLSKIAEGVDLCLENASRFCSDANLLIEKASYEHALGLCVFAIEELGKAVLLKSKAFETKRNSETDVVFKKEKLEDILHRTMENWKAKGFKGGRVVNPFYDHFSKLLMASSMMFIAIDTNVGKSIRGKIFHSIDEINKSFDGLLKEAYDLDFYNTDLREFALYVGYDEEKGEWTNGKLKSSPAKIKQLLTNIETAIKFYQLPSLDGFSHEP